MGHETAASSSADNGYICSLKRHLQEVLKVGFGGAEGSRTPDLLIANETLYQLSYDPIHQCAAIILTSSELTLGVFPECQNTREK